MEISSLTSNNFENAVSKNSAVLIEFFSPRCAPCKTVSEIIGSLGNDFDDLTVGTVNIESERELAKSFGVLSVPTLIFFKDGQLIQRSVGLISKEKLVELINKCTL